MSKEDLVPFVKGDPRINRKGRPKSFDAWRSLTVEVLREPAKDKNGEYIILVDEVSATEKDEHGKPLVLKSHVATNAEMIARSWLKDPKRQQALIDAAYGKVPDKVDVTSGGEKIVVTLKSE